MKISVILAVVASCLVALAVADFYDDGYGSFDSYGYGSMGSIGFGASPMYYPTTGSSGSQYPLLMLIGLLVLLMFLFGNNNNSNSDQIILVNSTLEG